MLKHYLAFALFFPLYSAAFGQNHPTPFNAPPAWAKQVIWYQIFVERFYNGDPSNDPKPENIDAPPINQVAPPGWQPTPWTHNWYEKDAWMKNTGKPFNHIVHNRRYGGDLQGVIDKLDYLQDLGVTALFLNPVNDAPSMHKYDARNYHHIDVNFGPDPAGDNRIIAAENPADPSTWKWTSADRLFLKLVKEAHRRGMRIIMDYSWNHTGTMFWAWQDVLKNQSASPYKDWYDIKSFDDPATPANEFAYNGWLGISSLPEIKKTNVTTHRVAGHPYEGNINEPAKKHVFSVTQRWLAPDGNPADGIDGFRLDVADQVGLGFWRDFRKFVRSVQPEAYLVGEIWWEKWPDHLMDPTPYTRGDVFDAVMFYQVYRPARDFFAKTNFDIDANRLKDSLELQWNRLSPEVRYAMMNVSSSHDAPRLLTCFDNPNKYKYQSTPNDNPAYKTGKPAPETYQRLGLYLVHLFTTIGAPQIWNGEEMGMWGADDPDCRKPLWWKEYRFEPETRNNFQPGPKKYDPVGFNAEQFGRYKTLIAIRKNNPVLSTGDIAFLKTEGKLLAYKRFDKNQEIVVAINAGAGKKTFVLPEKGDYVDLLTQKAVKGDQVALLPFSAVILKKMPVSSGMIKRFDNFSSRFVQSRHVDVWLPEGYSDKKKYAVLYMHDGQMLFDSTATWNRQEWGVDETAGKLLAAKKIKDCIVVGIWNVPELRHREYFPQKAFNHLSEADKKMLAEGPENTRPGLLSERPVSDNYLKFLVTELKPFIDSAFSTKTDPKNTFIAGSSMGGLISMYALCEYPDVFGGAACLSTHWVGIFRVENNPIPAVLMRYLKENLPAPNKHRIYFDHGTVALDGMYSSFQKQADAIVQEKGFTAKNWTTRVFEGADHSEKAWKSRLDIPLLFLLGK